MPCSLKAYENAEEKELKMEDPNSLKLGIETSTNSAGKTMLA
jgi:hypothetical protein